MTSPPMRRYDRMKLAAERLSAITEASMPTSGSTGRRPQLPRALRWASRIEAWPPALWLGLQALALWPLLHWAGRRYAGDGASPGLLALVLLASAAVRGHLACHWMARPAWLGAAAVLSLAFTAMVGVQSWPVLGTIAALAVTCSWAAFRATGKPLLPVLGLLCLGLPLQPAFSGLAIDSAPGSAALLASLAACTACGAALRNRLREWRFVTRLPGAVLAALICMAMHRGLQLVLLTSEMPMSLAAREAARFGILLFASAAVCLLVLRLMRKEG